MHFLSNTTFYPISLDEVKLKVAKKNGKRNVLTSNHDKQYTLFNHQLFKNIKEIINEFGEKIVRIDGDIPINLDISNGDRFLFISYDQSKFTHGLHKYPAKFFPELPRWIIKRYSNEGEIVLDPFAGSSTSNVEALLLKRNSVGIDVDPFSRFLSKVKTTPLDENEIKLAQIDILKALVAFNPLKVSENNIPFFPYRDNWFNKEIILELAYIKNIIESLDTNSDIRDFFKICFSSIIRSVSNADDNCTRTVIRKKLNKKVYPADALKKFAETILVNVPKIIEFSNIYPENTSVAFPDNMDARSIKYNDCFFDLALTSPPYANAVDYPRTHQLESYWLGLVNGSLTPLKRKHVGTESVLYANYKDLHAIDIEIADKVISKIYYKDKRRAYIAYKYLNDIKKNLEEVYRVLKIGGYYVIVVGNNKIRGELFENWKYIMALAEDIGFNVENYFASEIINHFIKVPREERINTDWILVLKKCF
jgi:DNA modification methylase